MFWSWRRNKIPGHSVGVKPSHSHGGDRLSSEQLWQQIGAEKQWQGRQSPWRLQVCKMGVKLVSLCLCISRKTTFILTHSHACCEPPAVTKQHQEKGGVRDALYCQQNSLNWRDYRFPERASLVKLSYQLHCYGSLAENQPRNADMSLWAASSAKLAHYRTFWRQVLDQDFPGCDFTVRAADRTHGDGQESILP